MAKVVDDFLLAGSRQEITRFHAAISKRFLVSQFSTDGPFTFNRLRITQHDNFDIEVSTEEYMKTIETLELSKDRRKEPNDNANPNEAYCISRPYWQAELPRP